MKIAKLFAYLGLAIFLPLWLFFFSDNEIKNKKDRETAEKKTTTNYLDSLLFLFAKSNQPHDPSAQITFSPNPQTERLLQELIETSTANARLAQTFMIEERNITEKALQDLIKVSTTNAKSVETDNKRLETKNALQELIGLSTSTQLLMNKERDIKISLSGIDATLNSDSSATTTQDQSDFPVYDLSENGPYRVWKITLNSSQKYKINFLVFNNQSQTNLAYIRSIKPVGSTDPAPTSPDPSLLKTDTFYLSASNQNIIRPQEQMIVRYGLAPVSAGLYYAEGSFESRRGRKLRDFIIPIVISRRD